MSEPDVVLVGYFGRGNFGDDVLMIVSHALARQILPAARIALRSAPHTEYLDRLLGAPVERVPFGSRGRHRLLLHGGGGNYFDFAKHHWLRQAKNALLLAGGAQAFVALDASLRLAVRRPRMSAQHRVGLGLGVGTFSPGSPRLLDALPELAEFDVLWLRDGDSEKNLATLGVAPPVVRGSDLAFFWEHWCPAGLALSSPLVRPKRPRLGVILRDWSDGVCPSFTQLTSLLAHLSGRFDLTAISLDPDADANTLAALGDIPFVLWRPAQMRIETLVEHLARQDVLLTSRAHGAICGACVGRPSVIVEIEPKLRTVHEMLSGATRLVADSLDPNTVASALEEALSIDFDQIVADVIRNRRESATAFGVVLERIAL